MAEVSIDVEPLAEARARRELAEDEPFRIAIMGDFSGRGQRAAESRGPVRAIEIDPENFEAVMEKMGAGLAVAVGDVNLAMKFRELDDFHPDHIYRSQPLFQMFEEAKRELAKAKPAAAPKTAAPPAAPTPASGGSLLDMIAEQQQPVTAEKPTIDDAIHAIVSRHTQPKADPKQAQAAAQIESTAAAAMRAILRNRDFQALEAAWRSIFFLFQQVDTGVELKIYLIDAARDESTSDAMLRALLSERFSVAAGLYTFTHSEADCALLSRLAKMARGAQAPFVAAIHPKLFGCESIAAAPDTDDWKRISDAEIAPWRGLRQSGDAHWLGLAMPRFLLRVPYGAKTSPVDCFDFEEMPNAPDHEAYLWANPAVAVVALLGAAFNQSGWRMQPGRINKLSSIPIHSIGNGDVTPPAEIWMTERFAMRVLDEGVMPLASVKHSDAVQLVYLKSIADPPAPLAGAWLS